MTIKEVIIDVLIPLITGFIGGSIGSIVIYNYKFSNKKVNNNGDKIVTKVVNKKTDFNNDGDVVFGKK